VGDNGSGKSTLARILCGLLGPSAGSVRLRLDDGDPRVVDRASLSRRVAYIFQDPDLQIFLPTVEEELAYGLRLQGLEEGRIAEVFRKGYSFRDRLLRPALVKVAKDPVGVPEAEDDERG